MEEDKREGLKLFWGALALTAIILSLAMVSTVVAVQPDMEETSSAGNDTFVYQPSAEDSLTMVAVGLSGEVPTDFLLIRYNPQYGQIPLVLLPPQTLIGDSTLAQTYLQKSPEAFKRALSRALGIEVDRYAALSDTPFLRIASKVGTVTYELPYEIAYSTENGPIRFSAGKQRLDGQALLALFAAPQLRTDPVEKSALLGNIVAEGINQNMNMGSAKNASGIFKFAINLVKTDINSTDFELRRQSAEYLAEVDRRYAGNLPVQGEWDGNRYLLAEETKKLIREYFVALP